MANIGIVATALAPDRTGGAETYLRKLLGCDQFQKDLEGHEVTVFSGTPCDAALKSCPFRVVECGVDSRNRMKRIFWEQSVLPGILRKAELDLVHFPYSTHCLTYTRPAVITVHDTANFIMPKSVCASEKIYRRILQRGIASNAKNHIIAVSETDKAVLQRNLGLPESRMSVVYHGAPEEFRLPGQAGEAEGTARPEGFLLWIGRPYYHKNILFLLEVQRRLREMQAIPPPLRLVGLDEEWRRKIRAEADRLGVGDLIVAEPPVAHADLAPIMREARLFLFPSLYESFGIPPLEAMLSGTPVVCSDLPILKEILGDAARYADPKDPAAFAAACAELLREEAVWREQVRRGHARADRYTWEACARDTVAVYHRALRSPRG